jgi:hypothetical protein
LELGLRNVGDLQEQLLSKIAANAGSDLREALMDGETSSRAISELCFGVQI